MAKPILTALQDFLRRDSAGGIVLLGVSVLALAVANSALGPSYHQIFSGPLLPVINDGLMALFFLLVSLEIKRELTVGELAAPAQALLPAVCALGGMVVPALVYLALGAAGRGWAIPTATDIAFSLGVLSLLGNRVPAGLKVFLAALAILDDLGAILVIALFYTQELSFMALGLAVLAVLGLVALNRRDGPLWAFAAVGSALWLCLLASGVHAVLAGVAVGLALPGRWAEAVERRLRPWVGFGIVPLFAFANAGLNLSGLGPGILGRPLFLGIAGGLFLGKQAGVMGACWLATRLTSAQLPEGVGWRQFYGAALLTGIGFTMSLFIGGLAFPGGGRDDELRLGVLAASLLSALAGAVALRFSGQRK